MSCDMDCHDCGVPSSDEKRLKTENKRLRKLVEMARVYIVTGCGSEELEKALAMDAIREAKQARRARSK